MAYRARLAKFRRRGGRFYFTFGGKEEVEFASRDEMTEWARAFDFNDDLVDDLMRRLFVRWWLHRNIGMDNPALVEGKTIILDLESDALPFRVV